MKQNTPDRGWRTRHAVGDVCESEFWRGPGPGGRSKGLS